MNYEQMLEFYLEESLVEKLLTVLPVLPEDQLAEVREVDQTVDGHLVGHVDHLLLPRVQAKRFHSTQNIL